MDRMDGWSGWLAMAKIVINVKIIMEIRTVSYVEDD
jgi:hypothetical protein